MKVAATVGQGDLTLPIRTDGDHRSPGSWSRSKAMQSHLSATLMRVQENTTEVASASSQIAAANLDLSARTGRPRPAHWNKPQPQWNKLLRPSKVTSR